ncbi:SDR family oxidoreductase [Kitasatospora sp. NPDC097643]|uniref:SDR family NAD(P)-dependent oxidoreductase n=1 Tax=Kitasatospora sp. NPDC097643 TaxID=3157230 RepID=UPI003326B3D9
MDLGLNGKRVLVTGGTRGVGRTTALAFARSGARVAVASRNAGEAADSLAAELKETGDGHVLLRADVTSAAGATALAAQAGQALGGLDVLVNNVGVDGQVPFEQLTEAEWHRVVDHNVTSTYLVTQAALGVLGDGSSIVNIGASAALRGRLRGAHYTASKAALIGLTRALAKELGPRGIRVNIVAPGVVETEPGGGLPPFVLEKLVGMTALGRLCRPEDVAAAVLFLAGDAAGCITGQTLDVDGGI